EAGDAIDILIEGDGVEAFLLVHLLGHGMLQQDTVDARVVVHFLDFREDVGGGGGFGKVNGGGIHTAAAAGGSVYLDVGGGTGVAADEDGSQHGDFSAGFLLERFDARGQAYFNVARERFSVEYNSCQVNLLAKRFESCSCALNPHPYGWGLADRA